MTNTFYALCGKPGLELVLRQEKYSQQVVFDFGLVLSFLGGGGLYLQHMEVPRLGVESELGHGGRS